LFARKTEDVNMIRRVQIFLTVHPAFLIFFFLSIAIFPSFDFAVYSLRCRAV